jgi:hypothetical protein
VSAIRDDFAIRAHCRVDQGKILMNGKEDLVGGRFSLGLYATINFFMGRPVIQ